MLFLFTTSVFADTAEPNIDPTRESVPLEANGTDYFAKAKAARIVYLESLVSAINGQLHEMVADKVATGKEMSALAKSVEDFNKEQAKAVETYKDIQVFLDPRIKELVDLYTTPMLRYGAKNQERMSYLLAGLTGTDVQKIGEDFQWGLLIILLVIFLVCLFLMIAGFAWDGEEFGALLLIIDIILLIFIFEGLCGA